MAWSSTSGGRGVGPAWKSGRRAAVARASAVAVVVMVLTVGAVAAPSLLQRGAPAQRCDLQLAREIGASSAGLCLRPLAVTVESNSSELLVPVLTIGPGQNGTVEILYTRQTYGSGNPLHPPLLGLNASKVPLALSVESGVVSSSSVSFSEGSLVYQNKTWIIYRYEVSTSPLSSGYYAILPPYYYGMYPALAVGAGPGTLNSSALALWGYGGPLQSEEVVFPSTIVMTAGFRVVNATVPVTMGCPDAACTVIVHSGY